MIDHYTSSRKSEVDTNEYCWCARHVIRLLVVYESVDYERYASRAITGAHFT
jgi:hypothetical protein